jgi:hypothetical protein
MPRKAAAASTPSGADADVDVDAGGCRIGGMNHAGHVAVGDERHIGPDLANSGDDVGVTGPVEHQRGDVARLDALGLGDLQDVFTRRRVEIDHALGIAGPDGDLFHVDVGRIEQRAAFRHGHGGDGPRHVLGAKGGALQRIDGDIDPRPILAADLFADEQHGRFVALALPDHHRAVDRQIVELAAHGVHRRLIGGLLVAAAAQAGGGDRRALGHAHYLQRQDALKHEMRLDRDRCHCEAPF